MSQREPIHEGGALITCLHQVESGFVARRLLSQLPNFLLRKKHQNISIILRHLLDYYWYFCILFSLKMAENARLQWVRISDRSA